MDSPLNILVVEDHDDLREATVAALSLMGHVVKGIDCAEALDDELGSFRPDLLLLDLNLPGEDGLSVARRMRAVEPDIGIIMATARDQGRDIATGYRTGADIYITKPTSPEELGAAVNALARRLRRRPPDANRLVLDSSTLQLRGPHGVVDLSSLECLLLAALARANDRRLEFWQLMEVSGKSADEFNKGALEAQMVRLRKKLEQAGAPAPTIKAIRGIGYQLCLPVEIANISVA